METANIKQTFMSTSISKKLMFWLVFITLTVMIIFGAINYYLFVNQLEKDLDNHLEERILVLEEDLSLHMWNLDNNKVREISEEYLHREGFLLLRIYDNFGEITYNVDSRDEEANYAVKIKEVSHNGEDVGIIEIAISTDYMSVAKRGIIRSLIVVIFSVFFTVFLVSFFVSRSISRPITNMARVVSSITEGDLDKKVIVETQDEIGQLGNSFNIMTQKLKKSYAGL